MKHLNTFFNLSMLAHDAMFTVTELTPEKIAIWLGIRIDDSSRLQIHSEAYAETAIRRIF